LYSPLSLHNILFHQYFVVVVVVVAAAAVVVAVVAINLIMHKSLRYGQ